MENGRKVVLLVPFKGKVRCKSPGIWNGIVLLVKPPNITFFSHLLTIILNLLHDCMILEESGIQKSVQFEVAIWTLNIITLAATSQALRPPSVLSELHSEQQGSGAVTRTPTYGWCRLKATQYEGCQHPSYDLVFYIKYYLTIIKLVKSVCNINQTKT